VERLIFSHSIEAYLRAVAPVLDDAFTGELKALGIDVGKPALPAYPVDVFRAALLAGARKLTPGKAEPEQLYALGLRYVDAYSDTLVGKALKLAIRLIGPRRTLERLARQFRTANNYSETKVTHEAPGRSELWCNDVTHAEWYRGVVTRTVLVAGASEVSTTLRRHDASGAYFLVEWK
jgi:uncharacterized protein (TIGR02265 family)